MSDGNSPQRYTETEPCPICGGWENHQRGSGGRCHGYLSSHNPKLAFCSQVPSGDEASGVYKHRTAGKCGCGSKHQLNHDRKPASRKKVRRNKVNRKKVKRKTKKTSTAKGDKAKSTGRQEPQDGYVYRDPEGNAVYAVIRLQPKGFRQARIDPDGTWDSKKGCMKGVTLYPYNLPAVIEAVAAGEAVWITEGEDDADAITEEGEVGTTNVGGAGKWRDAYSLYLVDAQKVVLWPDWDEKGRCHMAEVYRSIKRISPDTEIEIVRSYDGMKDAREQLDSGIGIHDAVSVSPSELGIEPTEDAPQASGLPADFDHLAGHDTANARRFVDLHEHHVRWVEQSKNWIVYDGVRWVATGQGQVWEWAIDVAKQITAEAYRESDPDRATQLRKNANRAHSTYGIKAMLIGVQSLLRVNANELDPNGNLLNFRNGTLDLDPKTLKENDWVPVLRPHSADDLITRVVQGDFDPEARSEEWEKLLKSSIPWPNTRKFFARCLGACMVGIPIKHFLYVQGPSDSGKTTVLEAFFHALGDYARAFEPEVFLHSKGGNTSSPDVALLPGVRMALSAELPPRRMFNSTLIKRVTGGDTQSARALYKMPFNFISVAFLVFVGNWMPGIEHHEEALWKRCFILCFKGPVRRKDKNLPRKLRTTESINAILAYGIHGYCDLAKREFNFAPTLRVKKATLDHRADMDTMRGFFEEECIEEEDAFVPAKGLFARYKDWAKEANIQWPLNHSQFTRELRSRGYENKRKQRIAGKVTSVWWGLRFREE